MKYSRTHLARAYIRLADTYSSFDLAKGFAELFIRNRGKQEIDAFSEDVVRMWGEAHDTAIITVMSALKLSVRARTRISSYVQRAEHVKHVSATYRIDESLVGGAVIQTSTHIYDFSVHDKLASLV